LKVILRERVSALGEPGDVVEVKPGFARNFLLPQGKALEATAGNIDSLRRQKSVVAARAERDRTKADKAAERITGLVCRLKQKAGEEDRLFGSVTAADIAEWLAAHGVEIERKRVMMEHPIKKLGEHTVRVKLYADVAADLKVVVEKEE
jgi:large subunit ribosomal protein L9